MKDRHGNKIRKGDWLLIPLNQQGFVMGEVLRVEDGGIALVKGDAASVSMARLVIGSTFTAMPEGNNEGFIKIAMPSKLTSAEGDN